ncbi:mannosyltransferase putative-domain-containing protein [Blyttiomyces helicus]|uniref:Mannosyltransferase putative-domain-containing protein n=1 Tax=Blyttiomyces helicus TaxID=388810 RepID=A0A4V1ISH6_9FUNG|nr:mannosyltransferase putative-domain-containing protein [Blyttiomyces helicus]|eukprot:RKO93587.1 mannosyltransferase putative-domain-containing protein [Blyttiomyces helicus]
MGGSRSVISRRSVAFLGALQILVLGTFAIFYSRDALLVIACQFHSSANSTAACERIRSSATTSVLDEAPSLPVVALTSTLPTPANVLITTPFIPPVASTSILPTSVAAPAPPPPGTATPLHVAGPCKPSNNDYLLREDDFKKWTDEDIDAKRRDWQSWLSDEFPKRADYDAVSSGLAAAGRPAMQGRGIVIYIGKPSHLPFLNTSVSMIRRYGCRLPIEVWSFQREFEKQGDRDAIEAMGTPDAPVTYRFAEDPRNYVPMERGKGDGYHIKVAAIINAGFSDVLALDVDSIPLSNPEFLFDSPEYVENGAIFWPDYWKTHDENPVWRWILWNFLILPSPEPPRSPTTQESGMLVIDKKQSWKALNLLWYVERDDEIRAWHDFVLGDKDLFRFSFRATDTRVYWVQHWIQPGGFLTPDERGIPTFCGIAMVQHAPDGVPLFAHVNFVKHSKKHLFSPSHVPISVIKRYKPIPEADLPPGPRIGSRMMWGSSRGAKARFIEPPNYTCVDIVGGKREGLDRETEIFSIDNVNPRFGADLYWGVIHEDALKEQREWKAKQESLAYRSFLKPAPGPYAILIFLPRQINSCTWDNFPLCLSSITVFGQFQVKKAAASRGEVDGGVTLSIEDA